MPMSFRLVRTALSTAALVALAQPNVVMPAEATSGTAPVSQPGLHGPTHRVSYRGVALQVPAAWPVVDLRANPHACVRLDQNAVYVGEPGAQQDCPAHAVGRANTIWMHGATGSGAGFPSSRLAKVGALAARVGSDPTGHDTTVQFSHQAVQVETSWASDSRTVESALSTATATSSTIAAPSPTPAAPSSAPAAPSSAPSPAPAALSSAALSSAPPATLDVSNAAFVSATPTSGSTFTGMGFDTCAAPTAATMRSWLASPYRSVGVYIGGSMRACGDGQLSSSWVSTVTSMGWGLQPIYVGPQAPCVGQSKLATITPSQAAAQGTANADDAINRAKYFGMGPGTPIYYDMEAYNTSTPGCSATVMKFMSAWSRELKSQGYSSGAYGSSDSLMTDLSRYMGSAGFVPPTNVWFAHWNGLQNTSDAASYPGFSDAYWTNHHRLHQYSGGATQTWGSASINIDASWLDGQVGGAAVPVNYGTAVVGPGSSGFVFTGPMDFWHQNVPPQGVKGMAYWTNSSGTSEYNGATWRPQLRPGLYTVRAYIPGNNAWAMAPYVIHYAGGPTTRSVNQQKISGYTSLGTYLSSASSPIWVHVGDNDGGSTTPPVPQLGIDAMAFTLVATPPGAPGSVHASAGSPTGSHQATVSWSPAASNGSPVTSYRVTASPGGASATVSGSSTSAVVAGLSNGTPYSFTVTAANTVGAGPASSPSNTVRLGQYSPHDWDGDGSADVLARDGGGALWLYPGDGTGGWLPARQVGRGWNGMTAIVGAGDFNGDGHPDVLARDGGGGALWLYPGDGTGGWLPGRQVGNGWNAMTAIVGAGDFNGDGHPDLLARDGHGALWLYPGDGAGGWLARRQVGTGWNAMTAIVGAGDLNGDRHADLLARDGNGALWLYPGDGAGGWLPRRQVGAGWNALTALIGGRDFNGDGHQDLLARDGKGILWLYAGNGAGGWQSRRQVGSSWNIMTATD